MSQIEMFEGPDAPPVMSPTGTAALRLPMLAKRFSELRQQMNILEAALTEVEDEIASYTPEVPGTTFIAAGAYVVSSTRPERWTWDRDTLAEMFREGEPPPYVKVTVGIDRKKFEALSPSEQAPLLPLLDRKVGNPKIEVLSK